MVSLSVPTSMEIGKGAPMPPMSARGTKHGGEASVFSSNNHKSSRAASCPLTSPDVPLCPYPGFLPSKPTSDFNRITSHHDQWVFYSPPLSSIVENNSATRRQYLPGHSQTVTQRCTAVYRGGNELNFTEFDNQVYIYWECIFKMNTYVCHDLTVNIFEK